MDSYEVPTAIVIDDDRLTVQVLCDYLETIDVKILARRPWWKRSGTTLQRTQARHSFFGSYNAKT